MKPVKPIKRNKAARALTSALFRQRKRPSKKLYSRRARTKNAGLRNQTGVSFCALVYLTARCGTLGSPGAVRLSM